MDKVKNNPLTIDTEAANNIIRVYYAKDTNGNGKPDYKEETYNVNFVAGENGKLEGTTLYKDYLSGTAINSAEGYKEPKAVADEGYAFDKWVVKDVEHKAGIETAEPGTYKVTGNTVVYAEFAKDTNGNGKPDYKEETYNVNFVAETNGTLTGTICLFCYKVHILLPYNPVFQFPPLVSFANSAYTTVFPVTL